MDRRAFIAGASTILGAALAVGAQPAAKTARIGWLAIGPEASPPVREVFVEGLRDLGYVEGRNVAIEDRRADGRPERLPALAAELVSMKVDVVVAPSTAAAVAARQATATIPIVSVAVPVPSTLAASLAQPGGNVTGLAFFSPELVGKCLEQLTEAVPGLGRVAVLWQPGGQGERTESDMLDRVGVAGRALAVRFQFVAARGPQDLGRAFSDMTRGRADAVTVLPSNMFFNERGRLADLAAQNRLPAVYPWRDFVEAGAFSPMEWTSPLCIAARRSTWTGSSRARSRRTCPSSNRQRSSSPST